MPTRNASKESRERYDAKVAEWLASGRGTALPTRNAAGVTVARLLAQFWRHARTYYRTPDGHTAEEAFNYRDALRPVLKLYSRLLDHRESRAQSCAGFGIDEARRAHPPPSTSPSLIRVPPKSTAIVDMGSSVSQDPLDERRQAADDPTWMADDRAIEIRPPAPAEIRACRMLLPRATESGHASKLLVATAGDPPRVVGAAAMTIEHRGDDGRGVVDLHVIPPCRRRGIARALLDRVLEQAKALDLASLRAWDWTPPESEAAKGWAALGFLPLQHRCDYQIDMVRALATLSPLLEKVRDRIPAGAQMISLAEADQDAVIRLHEQYLGGNARVLEPMLSGSAPNAYNRDLSTVLLLDGEVVGIALGRTFDDNTCEVDSRALHPSVRRRWANLWTLHEGLRRGVAAGLHTMRYFTLDEHEDTRQLSERFGGVLTASSVRMGRELRPRR